MPIEAPVLIDDADADLFTPASARRAWASPTAPAAAWNVLAPFTNGAVAEHAGIGPAASEKKSGECFVLDTARSALIHSLRPAQNDCRARGVHDGSVEKRFFAALGQKKPDAMRQAIANGMPVNGYVLDVFGDKKELTPLLYLADRGGVAPVVEVLLAAGADVNAPVMAGNEVRATPLGLAARRGNLPVVKLLLAAGADANAMYKADLTPLSNATSEKKPAHEAVMKALLAAGAKSNYQVLVGAARHGSPAMVEMLAASGADVNEISRWGTALILAANEKRVDTTEALLRAGADPHLRLPDDHQNYPGKTALDVAKEAKAKKVIPILEAALIGQLPVPSPPRPLDDVPKLWKRIEKALKANPAVKKSLKRGRPRSRSPPAKPRLVSPFRRTCERPI